jgi:hypothetical protein
MLHEVLFRVSSIVIGIVLAFVFIKLADLLENKMKDRRDLTMVRRIRAPRRKKTSQHKWRKNISPLPSPRPRSDSGFTNVPFIGRVEETESGPRVYYSPRVRIG